MEPNKQEKRQPTEEEKRILERSEETLKNIINMCNGFLTTMGVISGDIGNKKTDKLNEHISELLKDIKTHGSNQDGKDKDRIIERIGKLGETFTGNKALEKILSSRFQRPNK